MKIDHSDTRRKIRKAVPTVVSPVQKPTVAGAYRIPSTRSPNRKTRLVLVLLFGFKWTGRILRAVSESGEKIAVDGGTLSSYLAVHEKHPHSIGSIPWITWRCLNGLKARYSFIQTELLEFVVTEVSKHISCGVLPQQQGGRSLQRTCGPCP